MYLIPRKEWHQQELVNAAVEMIHKNFIEVAYKLVSSACTLNYSEGVNIFIKQLIKVGKASLFFSKFFFDVSNLLCEFFFSFHFIF